ncbi:MAG: YkgJ family cysteine cluster protein, partial [Phycisphaerae bacterium]
VKRWAGPLEAGGAGRYPGSGSSSCEFRVERQSPWADWASFEEWAVPNVKTKWYQAGLNFTCTQCGHCCSGPPGYVWVTRREIKGIAEYLDRKDGKLAPSQLRRVGLRHSLTEKSNGDCIFLVRQNGKATCSIYPVRPVQCRTWPFWDGNLHSPDDWNRAAETCPGINRGQHHDFVTIETRRRQT